MVTIEFEFDGKKKANVVVKHICSVVLDNDKVIVHHLDGKMTVLNCENYNQALALYDRVNATINRNQD